MTKQEKRDKAKARTKELIDKLDKGIKDIKSSNQFKAVLKCMAQFHNYSWSNCMLIHLQYPGAKKVAGFKAWQKMDRQVRKGEKGIRIFAPMFMKEKDRATGKETGETITLFRAVAVFDLGQTDGEDLPEMPNHNIYNTHGELLLKLAIIAHKLGINLHFTDLMNAEGISAGGQVAVQASKNPTEQALILIHELAHEMLHHGKDRPKLTREQKEMEAESVAYVVAQTYGIQHSNSEAYLALYQKSYDLKESIEAIHVTSQGILQAVKETVSQVREGMKV